MINWKNDIVLIVVLAVVTLVSYMGNLFYQEQGKEEGVAVVTVGGMYYGRYPLDVDTMEKIEFMDGSYNVLEIKDGEADIVEASCADQTCVKHRSVSKKSECIVCLPHKVIVEIETTEE